MKMKETLKFLKFGLIGVASVTAISTLAISCNEKKNENANNNNSDSTQKPSDTNNQEQIKQTLEAAKNAFTLTSIKEKPITDVRANTIKNAAQLKEYFTETPGADFGIDKGFTYTFKSANPKGETSLDVVYVISYKDTKETKETTINLTGFKGINQIDYNLEDDFFKIALDKEHLNTIAFFAQEYNFFKLDHFKTWKLTEDPTRYEATKTGQYFIFKDSKYYIYKINFKNTDDLKPIIVEFSSSAPGDWTDKAEVKFTPKGAQRNPFLFAVKEKEK